MKDKAIELLKGYTGKKNIYLTERGNRSILAALKIAKSKGFNKVFVQNQGGWITYLQYPKKLKMQMIRLTTDYGIVSSKELNTKLDKDSVLLINSMPGYFTEQHMSEVSSICKSKNSLLINDISGSIGTEDAKYGDILVGSFGEGKPVEVEYGGFIASDLNLIVDEAEFEKDKVIRLVDQLKSLKSTLDKFSEVHNKIKKDLSSFNIIHKDKKGINVIVAYSDDTEREKIINYCNEHNLEFTECPRYIRVDTNAISIEVKRRSLLQKASGNAFK